MDKVTDFLKEVRNRFSSPLFSSFIISWLVFNWRIPIALIFYKMEQLAKDGNLSYFDLIKKEANFDRGLLYPMTSAVAYTIVYPIIRNCIRALNAWANKWGTDWSLSLARNGKISMERYINLKKTYEKQTKIVEEVFEKETDYVQKNAELTNEKLELQKELSNWRRITRNYAAILN